MNEITSGLETEQSHVIACVISLEHIIVVNVIVFLKHTPPMPLNQMASCSLFIKALSTLTSASDRPNFYTLAANLPVEIITFSNNSSSSPMESIQFQPGV